MANETTSTTLDDLTQALISEVLFPFSQQGPNLAQFLTVRTEPKGKKGVLFPVYGAVTHSSVAEGTDGTNQAVSTSGVTITPGEYITMTTLTDIADQTSAVQFGVDFGKLTAEAKRDAINQAVFPLLDGFSTAIGTTNVDITLALIDQAVRQLVIAKAPRPYYMPVTPHVAEDLVGLYAALTVTNISSVTDVMQKDGVFGVLQPLRGVIPIMVDNLAAGTSAGQMDAADIKCGVYSAAALGMALRYEINTETQRDASLRAEELVITSAWGVGEIKDEWGIELLVDNKD